MTNKAMDGILVVDKPQGMTSHDVVDFIRRKFGLKKVGHAGTLDPMATGVLVMLIGKYTKASGTFTNEDKEYEAEIFLGQESDTGDAWGRVIPSNKPADYTDEKIRAVFDKFVGSIEQTPPMYSAKKHNGRKLYELARKGISVKVEPRKIFIEKIRIDNIALPRISFKVVCSKGTYIRQLCIDIGRELGCGAHLSALRRTRSGRFGIGQAVTIEELKNIDIAEIEKRLVI